MYRTFRTAVAAIALCCCISAGAQSFCVGVDSSPKGFGISAFIHPAEREFDSISICADTYGILSGRSSAPGVRATWLHEFVFAELERGDCVFTFYAGAGITTGWVQDFEGMFFASDKHRLDRPKGAVAALAGNAGCRMSFNRRLSAALSFQGDFGMHLTRVEELARTSVALYHNGIYHLPFPQLTILVAL